MSTRGGRAAGTRARPRDRSMSRHWFRFAVAPVLCSIRTHRGRYNRAALSNTRGSQTRVVLTLTGLPTHDRHSQTRNESRSQHTSSRPALSTREEPGRAGGVVQTSAGPRSTRRSNAPADSRQHDAARATTLIDQPDRTRRVSPALKEQDRQQPALLRTRERRSQLDWVKPVTESPSATSSGPRIRNFISLAGC